MKYQGQFPIFNLSAVKTYPLSTRDNKVNLEDYVNLDHLKRSPYHRCKEPWFRNGKKGAGEDQSIGLEELANYTVKCFREKKPIIVLSGAHFIKNGQSPICLELIRRGIITLIGTNGAGTIHSLELALTGASSESVRDALPKGEFGMAFETGAYLNNAIKLAHSKGFGYGEAMGRLYGDASFRKAVIDETFASHRDDTRYLKPYDGFPHADDNVFAVAWRKGVPTCVFGMIGTDIIDQHDTFDGEAKGAVSGADFLIFTEEISKCTNGGVILNIGTAVMGPEVVLKAVSMAANVGRKPDGLWTGDFDIRPFVFDDDVRDENHYYYYMRDQKSIATRIPKVFGGNGFYFQGMHEDTLVPFYQHILKALGEKE
ncbi:MAG: hypothetical protein JNL74_23155 [Fibrobacteres bacterium]|nr:hypothetical protein [Fibrobacterota bacterium]